MSDVAIILRNLRIAVRRGRGFLIFVSLGCALVILCLGIVAQSDLTGRELLASAALRTIELSSSHGQTAATPLTRGHLAEIAAMNEVAAVDPWLQAGFNTADDDWPAAVFWATPRIGYVQPPIVSSMREDIFPLAPDEVVLPSRYADQDLRPFMGRTVAIQYTERTGTDTGHAVDGSLTVVALYDESTFTLDGPTAAYASLETVLRFAAATEGTTPEQFGAQIPYPRAMVEVAEANDVPAVEQRLRDMGFAARSIQSQLQLLPQAMQMLSILGAVTAALLALYCLGAGITIGGAMVRNRQREIGLLKAVGFSRLRVGRLFLGELFAFGLLAGVIGVFAGNAIVLIVSQVISGGTFLGAQMADTLVVPDARWSLALLILPAGALALGGVIPARQAATLPPDEALRDL